MKKKGFTEELKDLQEAYEGVVGEGALEKIKGKVRDRQFKKYIKKARAKGGERSGDWGAYKGFFELAERDIRHNTDDIKRARKTPGYNLDNMLDSWEAGVKELKRHLKDADKKAGVK